MRRSVVIFFAACFVLGSAHFNSSPLELFRHSNPTVNIDQNIQLSVSPTVLNNSGDWVTASFSGIQNPMLYDVVAVYSPSIFNMLLNSPVKYQYANVSKEYMSTGSGSIRFRLVNMFSDYAFAFYRNLPNTTLVAVSEKVIFTNCEQPLQPHLALMDDVSQMRLSWASGKAQVQFVQYGNESGIYQQVLQSTFNTYSADDLCGAPAKNYGYKDPGLLHTAVLDLQGFTNQIYYIFGSDKTGWSEEFSFKIPSPVSSSNGVKIVAYGDMGKGEPDQSEEHWEEIPAINTTLNVAALIDKGEVDLVLHIGDIAYAVGFLAQWDEFMDQITPVASRVPYMTLPGNHERDYPDSGSFWTGIDSGGECGIPLERRFIMSDKLNHTIQWYSYDYGNVHFVMMSTELNYTRGSPQWKWIVSDLASVDRSVTPWVIFAGHRPMYIDSALKVDIDGAKTIRDSLEDVIVKYEVDLAIWGHHHSYQRTCSVFNGTCSPTHQYPVHVVMGMAGMDLCPVTNSTPSWMAALDDKEFGFTTIETTENQLTLTFFNNNNEVRDEFYIKKKSNKTR